MLDDAILLKAPVQNVPVPADIDEEINAILEEAPPAPPTRFGLVDLWNIHGKKRFASSFPRRTF